MVHYSDIPERVQIIGKSGQPLGQLVTVRGRWAGLLAKPDKACEPIVFRVNQVNGRPLDPPAKFWAKEDAEFTKKTVGEEWELRGVETGGFVGFNEEVWEELLGEPPMQRPPEGFLTRFCYVKAKRVSGSKPTDSAKE